MPQFNITVGFPPVNYLIVVRGGIVGISVLTPVGYSPSDEELRTVQDMIPDLLDTFNEFPPTPPSSPQL